jgi:hypothetical protein
MAAVGLAITDVDGNANNPAIMDHPPPWTVHGTVTFAAPPAGNQIATIAYQVNEGPIITFIPPLGAAPNVPANYTFPITGSEIPVNGQYQLTVYAWDTDIGGANPGVNMASVNITVTSANQIIINLQGLTQGLLP